MTASQEITAIENRDILKANGFHIYIADDAMAGQKLALTTMPSLKNVSLSEQGKLFVHENLQSK